MIVKLMFAIRIPVLIRIGAATYIDRVHLGSGTLGSAWFRFDGGLLLE